MFNAIGTLKPPDKCLNYTDAPTPEILIIVFSRVHSSVLLKVPSNGYITKQFLKLECACTQITWENDSVDCDSAGLGWVPRFCISRKVISVLLLCGPHVSGKACYTDVFGNGARARAGAHSFASLLSLSPTHTLFIYFRFQW